MEESTQSHVDVSIWQPVHVGTPTRISEPQLTLSSAQVALMAPSQVSGGVITSSPHVLWKPKIFTLSG